MTIRSGPIKHPKYSITDDWTRSAVNPLRTKVSWVSWIRKWLDQHTLIKTSTMRLLKFAIKNSLDSPKTLNVSLTRQGHLAPTHYRSGWPDTCRLEEQRLACCRVQRRRTCMGDQNLVCGVEDQNPSNLECVFNVERRTVGRISTRSLKYQGSFGYIVW